MHQKLALFLGLGGRVKIVMAGYVKLLMNAEEDEGRVR